MNRPRCWANRLRLFARIRDWLRPNRVDPADGSPEIKVDSFEDSISRPQFFSIERCECLRAGACPGLNGRTLHG